MNDQYVFGIYDWMASLLDQAMFSSANVDYSMATLSALRTAAPVPKFDACGQCPPTNRSPSLDSTDTSDIFSLSRTNRRSYLEYARHFQRHCLSCQGKVRTDILKVYQHTPTKPCSRCPVTTRALNGVHTLCSARIGTPAPQRREHLVQADVHLVSTTLVNIVPYQYYDTLRRTRPATLCAQCR